MPLHGLDGHEQRLGDLAVREPLGRHLGHAPLRRSKRINAAQLAPPRARSRGRELIESAALECERAEALGHLEPLAQGLARLAATARPPQSPPEVDERPRMLERGGRGCERRDGLAQEVDPRLGARDESERPQGDADRTPGAEAAGEGELLLGQLEGAVVLAEGRGGEGSL